jgi:hypothetical protein
MSVALVAIVFYTKYAFACGKGVLLTSYFIALTCSTATPTFYLYLLTPRYSLLPPRYSFPLIHGLALLQKGHDALASVFGIGQ